MVIVDTSAWINFLKQPESEAGRELARLLQANEVMMVGLVIAEVLQGTRLDEFSAMRARLISFPYLQDTKSNWLKAAELSASLKAQGLTTPLSDLLIATQALESNQPVFALDNHFQRVPGLQLYQAATT